ncbi:pentapeptide repeat-containing protein [Streptomyces sp. NRRL S-337]|uniref:pentapeptide repeat-containing protein n=1 Tax=Streptomyces sp. NRRL S-337 TaxID=1463900 RepID=UPI0004CA9676|nr:pentapeptide repeat-containing protein [Streptomyces sp. NRRL S-337]
MSPGADIDHRGTAFTDELLRELLDALTDPAEGRPRVGMAHFDQAEFYGDTVFDAVTFAFPAWFAGATFGDAVSFNGAEFGGEAHFEGTHFGGSAAARVARDFQRLG